jgi:hypothetical protein
MRVGLYGGTQEVCNDVTRDAGGCDPNQPTFEAMDCPDLAASTAQQITERLTNVYQGPAGGEDSKATQALKHTTLVVVRLNQHVREHDLPCYSDNMWELMEPLFPAEFRPIAGTLLYDWEIQDQPEPTWDDWVERFRTRTLTLLDGERESPTPVES